MKYSLILFSACVISITILQFFRYRECLSIAAEVHHVTEKPIILQHEYSISESTESKCRVSEYGISTPISVEECKTNAKNQNADFLVWKMNGECGDRGQCRTYTAHNGLEKCSEMKNKAISDEGFVEKGVPYGSKSNLLSTCTKSEHGFHNPLTEEQCRSARKVRNADMVAWKRTNGHPSKGVCRTYTTGNGPFRCNEMMKYAIEKEGFSDITQYSESTEPECKETKHGFSVPMTVDECIAVKNEKNADFLVWRPERGHTDRGGCRTYTSKHGDSECVTMKDNAIFNDGYTEIGRSTVETVETVDEPVVPSCKTTRHGFFMPITVDQCKKVAYDKDADYLVWRPEKGFSHKGGCRTYTGANGSGKCADLRDKAIANEAYIDIPKPFDQSNPFADCDIGEYREVDRTRDECVSIASNRNSDYVAWKENPSNPDHGICKTYNKVHYVNNCEDIHRHDVHTQGYADLTS